MGFSTSQPYEVAFVGDLGEAGSQGRAPRDWVTVLVIPLALAGVGYLYTSYETRRTLAVEETRSEENRIGTFSSTR